MAKVKLLQTNFTSGVIDPKLAAREDIVFYYNGLKDAENLLVIPQGGVTARPAGEFVRELAPVLAAIDIAGATITAPQGGDVDDLKDNDPENQFETANNLAATDPFVIARFDLTAAKEITAVDVLNYRLGAGLLDDELYIQYSEDDAAWHDYGAPFNAAAENRSRRLRHEAGPVSARYWRFVRIGDTDIAAKMLVGLIRFWEETGDLSAARLLPFANSTEEAYMFAVTGGNIDVLVGDQYHGAIAIPHSSAQLELLNYAQSFDTMVLYHGRVAPYRIFRQGDDDEFDFRNFAFTNIPQYDYGAGSGGADEAQELNDGGSLASGNKFTILLEGERTKTITGGASRDASATAIEAALRELSNTSAAGITVTDNTNGFTVTFAGDDGVQEWDLMSVSVMTGNSVWSTSRITKGRPPGEDIMSDARGWPRCGVLDYQARHHMGGIPGAPDVWLASVVGQIENFDIDQDDALRAIVKRASSDQVGAIYQMVVGRHLSFFANDGEFYIPQATIDQDASPRRSTGSGSKEAMRVHEVDGALLFVQGVKGEDGGRERATSVREFIFVDTEQSYRAQLISKLSSHLIKNPVDVTLRKALSTDEADILLMVNEDGSATAYTVLRDDVVNAFMPITISSKGRDDDRLLACAVDKKRRVYWIAERVINGVKRRYVEMWNDKLFLDCGGIVTCEAETFTATEGQTEFTWSFTSPADEDAIGVRLGGGRIEDGYAVDLGAKKVTLAEGVAAGTVVRIAHMRDTVEGLDHLEGETVQTFLDGTPGPDFTIDAGVLALDRYADTEIQYGFDFEVGGALMPFRIPESETLAGDKIRCVSLTAILHETSGFALRVNGGRWQDVPLIKMDDAVLDRSLMELLFTGEVIRQGLPGYAVGAPVEFRRPGPGPFTLLGIAREVTL